jgi:hypothetical protein
MTMTTITEQLRGTGRTHQQMLDAPDGTIFVMPNSGMAEYGRKMANKIGRSDIEFVTLGRPLVGYSRHIVFDHSIQEREKLTPNQLRIKYRNGEAA